MNLIKYNDQDSNIVTKNNKTKSHTEAIKRETQEQY